MEDHFKRLLDVGTTSATSEVNSSDSFISSKQFTGRKVGFVFKNGDLGIGYYYDPVQGIELSAFPSDRKRKLDDTSDEGFFEYKSFIL